MERGAVAAPVRGWVLVPRQVLEPVQSPQGAQAVAAQAVHWFPPVPVQVQVLEQVQVQVQYLIPEVP